MKIWNNLSILIHLFLQYPILYIYIYTYIHIVMNKNGKKEIFGNIRNNLCNIYYIYYKIRWRKHILFQQQ